MRMLYTDYQDTQKNYSFNRIAELKEMIKNIDQKFIDARNKKIKLSKNERNYIEMLKAFYLDELKKEKKKKLEKEFPFPIDGQFSSYFKRKTSEKTITFTLTEKDFLSLVRREDQGISFNNKATYVNIMERYYNVGGYSETDHERFGNNDLLVKLVASYKAGEISDDLEHKLIWLYPNFAIALGVNNLSRQSQNLIIYRRPSIIKEFKKTTTKQQMLAISNGENWMNIFNIRYPHKPVLAIAAKKAEEYLEAKAKDLHDEKGPLCSYESDELKNIYNLFDKCNKLDPILKQDILGTIVSTFLEHEMDDFTD